LQPYRQIVHSHYRQAARAPGAAITLLEAFNGVQTGTKTISWVAYPRSVRRSDQEIDQDRFRLQEEYVEWSIDRQADGTIQRVTFTTILPEYFEALSMVGASSLVRGIQQFYPSANPSHADLFGNQFNPDSALPEARAAQFRKHMKNNPFNDGTSGILCLSQRINTMVALFQLVTDCSVPKTDIPAANMCAFIGTTTGACGAERNSDPAVCSAAQDASRQTKAITLADPVGVRILRLGGIWRLGGSVIDINDSAQNGGAWAISHNGRRAVLEVQPGLTIGDDRIVTGAQVSRLLTVAADVIAAPEDRIPAWAWIGNESSRLIA
jgi:hypothetical protein